MSNHKISVSLILAVAGLATGVHAEPVRWFLEDVRFADGTSATGSFIFDVDAGEDERYLEIDIVTTPGPVAGGARYRDPNPDSPGNPSVMVAMPGASSRLTRKDSPAKGLVCRMTVQGRAVTSTTSSPPKNASNS